MSYHVGEQISRIISHRRIGKEFSLVEFNESSDRLARRRRVISFVQGARDVLVNRRGLPLVDEKMTYIDTLPFTYGLFNGESKESIEHIVEYAYMDISDFEYMPPTRTERNEYLYSNFVGNTDGPDDAAYILLDLCKSFMGRAEERLVFMTVQEYILNKWFWFDNAARETVPSLMDGTKNIMQIYEALHGPRSDHGW